MVSERLLDQLDEAETQASWDSVRDLARDVLEIDPGNSEATAYLRAAERRLDTAAAIPVTQTDSGSAAADRDNRPTHLLRGKVT